MTVAELIGSATVRIERVTRSIRREEMDKLESAGIPGDIRWLREEYATLDDALRGSCSFIRDEWPAIQGNRGRLYELRLLEDSFSRFTSTVTGFDDAVTADEHSAEKLLGEYEASREYAILAAQYGLDGAGDIGLPVPAHIFVRPECEQAFGVCVVRDRGEGRRA